MSGLWSTKCPVEWRINAADYIILTRLPLAQHHKFSIFPTFENNFAYPVSDFNKSLYYNRIHRPVEKKRGGGITESGRANMPFIIFLFSVQIFKISKSSGLLHLRNSSRYFGFLLSPKEKS